MKNKNLTYNNNVNIAALITSALSLMYGIVPYYINKIGLYGAEYAQINLIYSIVLVIIIMTLPKNVPTIFQNIVFKQRNNIFLTCSVFCISAVIFYFFPWHSDRESAGASVAAAFRALWFVIGASYVASTERTKLFVGIATVVLMYIDESRTYFLLLLIVLAAGSRYKIPALFVGLFAAIILAALRMDSASNALDMLFYGIIGEGYNGTKAVGQINAISYIRIDELAHIASTLMQPISLPFDLFMSSIDDGYRLQDYYLIDAVMIYLNEKFNPMGGWFVVADFVYYGYYGLPILWIYMIITWYVSRMFLDTAYFPFGAFFLFIAIKATPFVYWKFFYYLIAISLIYNLLFSIKLKRSNA